MVCTHEYDEPNGQSGEVAQAVWFQYIKWKCDKSDNTYILRERYNCCVPMCFMIGYKSKSHEPGVALNPRSLSRAAYTIHPFTHHRRTLSFPCFWIDKCSTTVRIATRNEPPPLATAAQLFARSHPRGVKFIRNSFFT